MPACNGGIVFYNRQLVSAALPLQEHWLPQSNLDLLLPPIDVGLFFCYKKPKSSNAKPDFDFHSMVVILKSSLAEVLVSYYAFAGEVVTNSCGEPELLCNNRGVEFIEAHAGDMELAKLDLHNPDVSVEGKLVPKKKDGVLCIQVTELGCGGVVVGCTFDHRIADAYSANMFMLAWSNIAVNNKPSTINVPSFRRSLLNPRRPSSSAAAIFAMMDHLYVPIPSLPPPSTQNIDHDINMINRIYYITASDIAELQSLASAGGHSRTKLEAFSALLWQLLAMSTCKANHDQNKRCKLGILVDGRTRLGKDGELANYFGNVLSIPYGDEPAEEMAAMPFHVVAEKVHDFLAVAATKEHFEALIDWVETTRPVPMMTRIYSYGGPSVVMSSGIMRFPVREVVFGWGMPAFGSYHFPWGGDSGYVMPMPSSKGNGDWVVYLHMQEKQVAVVEAVAGKIFRPLTPAYLELDQ